MGKYTEATMPWLLCDTQSAKLFRFGGCEDTRIGSAGTKARDYKMETALGVAEQTKRLQLRCEVGDKVERTEIVAKSGRVTAG